MKLQLKAPDMACSACADTITEAITSVDSTAQVEADPKTKMVDVETQQSERAIKEAMTEAGYSASSPSFMQKLKFWSS